MNHHASITAFFAGLEGFPMIESFLRLRGVILRARACETISDGVSLPAGNFAGMFLWITARPDDSYSVYATAAIVCGEFPAHDGQ
jgi:hypothetical protein